MAAKKARKRAYIPPSSEVVNKRERVAPTPRAQRSQAQRNQRAGSSAYVYPTPSFKRTAKRLPIYFVLIFALQYWFAGQDARGFDTQERITFALGSAAFVTVLFAPFMHVMDKFAYNRYLKRTGTQPAVKPSAKQD